MKIEFMKHQVDVLDQSKDFDNVAYYLDMGLGKTFIGAERLIRKNKVINLVICQKSKVNDWIEHFNMYYYQFPHLAVTYDLTDRNQFDVFIEKSRKHDDMRCHIGVINYDLAFRRKDLLKIEDFTLLLDESSLIQNDKAKRTKFILKMKYDNVILLSGTPTSGKYENLWSQCHLLGWDISKRAYDYTYVNFKKIESGNFIHKIVDPDEPYKNVERLKKKMRDHGAIFMKTEEVMSLPEQTFIEMKCRTTKAYRTFMKESYVSFNDMEFVGDTDLTKRLYARLLCTVYNSDKLKMFEDLICSTQDRIICFYNFNAELEVLKEICKAYEKPISVVNGADKDLKNYEENENSVTLIQYQAGAFGLNLQKANKIIFFSLTDKSELFEQAKKRIHRIGQTNRCFYYILMCEHSIDESIYERLKERKDYTDDLFREEQRKNY